MQEPLFSLPECSAAILWERKTAATFWTGKLFLCRKPEPFWLFQLSSPMFLAGYMMTQAVQAAAGVPVFLWQMAVSIYLPALPIFFLASWLYGFRRRKDPGKLQTADCRHSKTISGVLDEAMSSSAETMVKNRHVSDAFFDSGPVYYPAPPSQEICCR